MSFAMRLFRPFAGAFALIAALSAAAEVRVVLHAPREGEVLRGGTRATVAWSAAGLPRFVEEWEAFLSVDGGKYYAYRITPHLEADQRRFTFDVPNVETGQARILIRAGDELRELELESSRTFAIRKDTARALAAAPLEVAEEKRGEAARAGERGVIEWIDGDRHGSHLTPYSARRRPLAIHGTPTVELHVASVEEPVVESSTAPRHAASPAIFAVELSPTPGASRHRTGRDVLLAYRRLNI
jgi:hypothetical protein